MAYLIFSEVLFQTLTFLIQTHEYKQTIKDI